MRSQGFDHDNLQPKKDLDRFLYWTMEAVEKHYANQKPVDSPGDLDMVERLPGLIKSREEIAERKGRVDADRATLENIGTLLNGDNNQIGVVKGYVWNKLSTNRPESQ